MKSIIKAVLSALLITSLLFTCSSCASEIDDSKDTTNVKITDSVSSDTEAPNSPLFPEKGKSKPYGTADFDPSVFSATIPEMYGKVQAVILGDVTKDGMSESSEVKTFANVSVLHVWKGDIKKREVINVSESGVKFENGTDASIGGEPLLKKNMRVILFLSQPEGKLDYEIIGSFQGKFFLNNDGNVYSYEYFSDEYNDRYFSDVHESISYEDFKAILDSLSVAESGEVGTEALTPDA